jgi:hypothetical protein
MDDLLEQAQAQAVDSCRCLGERKREPEARVSDGVLS